jgi:hypothetical protein
MDFNGVASIGATTINSNVLLNNFLTETNSSPNRFKRQERDNMG